MILHINHVASDDDVKEIRQAFQACGIPVSFFDHLKTEVRAIVRADLPDESLALLSRTLDAGGHELHPDRGYPMVCEVKKIIRETVNCTDYANQNCSMPKLLAKRMNVSFRYLSRTFSNSEGITIERFLLLRKIECVKELLGKGTSLMDIAFDLHYCSVPHLSRQFKRLVGITITEYRGRIASERDCRFRENCLEPCAYDEFDSPEESGTDSGNEFAEPRRMLVNA